MFILVRVINEYTGADICLGVFENEDNASRASKKYREYFLNSPELDLYKNQCYINEHLSKDQLYITQRQGNFVNGEKVYLVVLYLEGFGQITIKIDSLFSNKKDADSRGRILDDLEDWECSYFEVQEFIVGELEINEK